MYQQTTERRSSVFGRRSSTVQEPVPSPAHKHHHHHHHHHHHREEREEVGGEYASSSGLDLSTSGRRRSSANPMAGFHESHPSAPAPTPNMSRRGTTDDTYYVPQQSTVPSSSPPSASPPAIERLEATFDRVEKRLSVSVDPSPMVMGNGIRVLGSRSPGTSSEDYTYSEDVAPSIESVTEFLQMHASVPCPPVNAALASGDGRCRSTIDNIDTALTHGDFPVPAGTLVVAEGEHAEFERGSAVCPTYICGSSHSYYLYHVARIRQGVGSYLLLSTGLKFFSLARDVSRLTENDDPNLAELDKPVLFHRGARFFIDRVEKKKGGIALMSMHEVPSWRGFEVWVDRDCPTFCRPRPIPTVFVYLVGVRGLEADKEYTFILAGMKTDKRKTTWNSVEETYEAYWDHNFGQIELKDSLRVTLIENHRVHADRTIIDETLHLKQVYESASKGWGVVPTIYESTLGTQGSCEHPAALLTFTNIPVEGGLV